MAGKVFFSDSRALAERIKNESLRQNTFLTLESTTCPKHTVKSRRTSEAFSELFKGEVYITKREFVSLGGDYTAWVNAQRIKEGLEPDFQSQGLPWGEWYGAGKIIIRHKDTYYLRYTLKKNANYRHSEKVYHYENGSALTEEEEKIYKEEFLPKKSKSKTQGVEQEIEVRNVKLEGITRMVFNQTAYVRQGYENREEKEEILSFFYRAKEIIAEKIRQYSN